MRRGDSSARTKRTEFLALSDGAMNGGGGGAADSASFSEAEVSAEIIKYLNRSWLKVGRDALCLT